ncbi:MAG: hypothetical protein AAF747_07065 [Planctomycetota bacterium]
MSKTKQAAYQPFETLEPRCLLDSSFASVGIAVGPSQGLPGVEVFSTEGIVRDDGSVGGDLFIDGDGGRDLEDSDLFYNSITKLQDGRFLRDPDNGFLTNDALETNGAQFLNSDGFPAGWFFAQHTGDREEIELLVELPGFGVSENDFDGRYTFTAIGLDLDAGDYFTAVGRMDIEANGNDIEFDETDGFFPVSSLNYDRVDPAGILSVDDSEYFYISQDGNTIIFADMDTNDGEVYIGIATREPTGSVEFNQMVGQYLWVDGFGANSSADFRQLLLQLEDDGDYRIFDLDDFDSGITDNELERGFWRVDGSRVVLENDNGGDIDLELNLVVGEGGDILVPQEIDRQAFSDLPTFGLLVRSQAPADGGPLPGGPGGVDVLSIAARNELGELVVFQREADGNWYESNVAESVGIPNINGELESWIDPATGRTQAVTLTATGVLLFTEQADGSFTLRNLSTELGATDIPTSELEVMRAANGNIYVTGLDASNDLITYFENGQLTSNNENAWAHKNITQDDLVPNGLATPAFSELVSYAVPWGGLNVVGLDSNGTIWGVWTGDGIAPWTVSDLTTTFGAVPLVGGLTVFQTSWFAINIVGVDAAGDVQATWWVPSFGGDWAQTNLTTDIGAPQLDVATISAFVTSWGALNVVGADVNTGEVTAYWWTPARTELGWTFNSLSDTVPAGSPALTGPYEGVNGDDDSLNVFGRGPSVTGGGTEFVRYFWQPTTGQWLAETITDVAIVRS